jgi:hypothetical protein
MHGEQIANLSWYIVSESDTQFGKMHAELIANMNWYIVICGLIVILSFVGAINYVILQGRFGYIY